ELAQQVERVFVLEPALGEDGRLKTARKGVGTFYLNVEGRAAHAGLDPQKGASAIVELAHQIQQLSALTDLTRGVTVNVGVVAGGVGANVIAPSSSAVVDVRVPTAAVAAEVSAAVRGLRAVTPGTSVTIKGAINRPPLEQTPANRTLWRLAQSTAASLDLHLEEGMAGGGSDGNFTSQYAATLDGLGAVGDGAHALHEFIYLDKMVERAALLALLLLAPPLGES
ncbi:MAG: M20/M25/M40 family metallo-hydrolase, partial [Candidatus Promineifilaceae bacterium]|nr:M20/M25/M40 family metallo-hydrolase [Candidatus Promineifilaceae bacterium]